LSDRLSLAENAIEDWGCDQAAANAEQAAHESQRSTERQGGEKIGYGQ
jgi:hypothetical protein